MRYELSPLDVEMMRQNNRHLEQMMALAADRNRLKRLALMSVPLVGLLTVLAVWEGAMILWAVK